MTKTDASDGRRRKSATGGVVWTREKISQLIQLYRNHECLWNHYIDHYKSKDHRNKSINEICHTLNITKFDFGKKIHNLRNQYNSENKKLERRLEECGGELSASNGGRCRWEHFESLMFLRNVIESRPCGYQQTSFRQPKKMRLKFDYISEDEGESAFITNSSESQTNAASAAPTISAEDVTEYHFEEATEDEETLAEEDFQNYDVEEVHDATTEDADALYDQKYNPQTNAPSPPEKLTTSSVPAPTNKTYVTRVVQQKSKQTQPPENETLLPPMGSVIELPGPAPSCSSSTRTSVEQHQQTHLLCSTTASASSRDQWDNLGELIATEFRNLNSDVSRKKLKRKIMQAMLEVGEEDDALSFSGQK